MTNNRNFLTSTRVLFACKNIPIIPHRVLLVSKDGTFGLFHKMFEYKISDLSFCSSINRKCSFYLKTHLNDAFEAPVWDLDAVSAQDD